jgi:hypothetical protein
MPTRRLIETAPSVLGILIERTRMTVVTSNYTFGDGLLTVLEIAFLFRNYSGRRLRRLGRIAAERNECCARGACKRGFFLFVVR